MGILQEEGGGVFRRLKDRGRGVFSVLGEEEEGGGLNWVIKSFKHI